MIINFIYFHKSYQVFQILCIFTTSMGRYLGNAKDSISLSESVYGELKRG